MVETRIRPGISADAGPSSEGATNMACQTPARLPKRKALRWLEIALWALGAAGLGIFLFVFLERGIYQAYESWEFNRELNKEASAVKPAESVDAPDAFDNLKPAAPGPVKLAPGDLIGRIEIPDVGVSAMIVESAGADELRRAVGHIQGTALPGKAGNAAFAGHRDTFFRGLRDIKKDDRIKVVTLHGTYEYVVDSTKIVDPDDLAVLDPTKDPSLTLVTCYPFYYIGHAPKRFIVQAREVGKIK
jgi:sortase A